MGLTIHYGLKYKGSDMGAMKKVVALRERIAKLYPNDDVSEVKVFEGEAADYNKRPRDRWTWLLIQAQANVVVYRRSDGMGGCSMDASPLKAIVFETAPAEGSEPANFGLCRYPATVNWNGQTIETKLEGWRWHSFCKTQYASDPTCGGVPNFVKCHLFVVSVLDLAKEAGILKEVSDEGDYWTKRDADALAEEVGTWNGMIAAFGGALKDAMGGATSSPIFDRPDFEHLEFKGLKDENVRKVAEAVRSMHSVRK